MASMLARLANLDGTTLADLLRAGLELCLARMRLGSPDLRSLVAAEAGSPSIFEPRLKRLIERVAFAIPRVAAHLPWRADCLVQALAAERWLRREGIASCLHLGVPKVKADALQAHAWLTVGERIVIGGKIKEYVPLEGKR